MSADDDTPWTVRELIDELSKMDPDMPVLTTSYDPEWGETNLFPFCGFDTGEVSSKDILMSYGTHTYWEFGGEILAVLL